MRDVANLAKVSPDTIARLERGDALKERTVTAVRAVLEAAGVEFIAENGGGAGVRLKKPASTRGDVDGNIGALDAKAKALDFDGAPNPRKAMNQPKKALVENEKKKRENKRRLAKKLHSP